MKVKILFLIVLFICIESAANAQVAVIANKSVPLGSINKSRLMDIYSISQKNWDNGEKIVVYDLKSDNNTKERFYKYLGKSNSELKKIWMRIQLTGGGSAPYSLYSEDEVLAKVASTPGAIGFVDMKNVTGAVKVISRIE